MSTTASTATRRAVGTGRDWRRWGWSPAARFGTGTGSTVRPGDLPHDRGELGAGWRDGSVTGYDLTFSAPKSVSTLWALGDEVTVAQVEAAHSAAVRTALGYLEQVASWSRRGRNGVEQIATGGYAAALFEHGTSRTGDPQLHTHSLVVNKARCVDGAWRTLDGREVYHHKKAAGALYQAALRAELTTRLQVAFGPVSEHGQAEITGVPTELHVLVVDPDGGGDGRRHTHDRADRSRPRPGPVPRRAGPGGQDRGPGYPPTQTPARRRGPAGGVGDPSRRGRVGRDRLTDAITTAAATVETPTGSPATVPGSSTTAVSVLASSRCLPPPSSVAMTRAVPTRYSSTRSVPARVVTSGCPMTRTVTAAQTRGIGSGCDRGGHRCRAEQSGVVSR